MSHQARATEHSTADTPLCPSCGSVLHRIRPVQGVSLAECRNSTGHGDDRRRCAQKIAVSTYGGVVDTYEVTPEEWAAIERLEKQRDSIRRAELHMLLGLLEPTGSRG